MKKDIVILLLLVLLCATVVTSSGSGWEMLDYRDHNCTRPCDEVVACESGVEECWKPVEPMTCEYTFTLEWYLAMSKGCYGCPFPESDCSRRYCASADGFPRGIQTANRMLPGPAIQVCQNDRIVVRVHNKLEETAEMTGIHWHGIHQKETQYMDGVPMVTQCPIHPGSAFTYNFKASPPGTHFWHSHSGFQRADGIFGALIVRQPKSTDPHYRMELYDEDLPEHVVLINDWAHELAISKFVSNHYKKDENDQPTGEEATPKGMLINGLGESVRKWDPDHENDDTKRKYTPRAKFTVDEGKRYRFRVISNGILNCPIQISVQSHDLLIIASDGGLLTPYSTRSLVLFAGERYDFVLNADRPAGNYWFRAGGLGDCARVKVSQAAIIHYSSASDENPPGPTDYHSMFDIDKIVNPFVKKTDSAADHLRVPISFLRAVPESDADPALRQNHDYQFWFGMDFSSVDNTDPEMVRNRAFQGGLRWPQLLNISHEMPPSPLLSQPGDIDEDSYCSEEMISNTIRYCAYEFCSCVHRYKIKLNSVVEVILVDEGVTFDTSHPMHLHGYSFRVLGQDDRINGKEQVFIEDVKELDRNGSLPRNFENPPIKDTVIVPDSGYTIIRFYANNPGAWFFHCHLQFHSELGMGVVFVVGEPGDTPPVPKGFPKCGNFDGGAAGLTLGWTILAMCLLVASVTG